MNIIPHRKNYISDIFRSIFFSRSFAIIEVNMKALLYIAFIFIVALFIGHLNLITKRRNLITIKNDFPFTIEKKGTNFTYLKDLQLHSNRTKQCGAHKCGYPLENDLILLLLRTKDYGINTNAYVARLEKEYIALEMMKRKIFHPP